MIEYELKWILRICCIEESQIYGTIQPVADSLGLDVSRVDIESYAAFDRQRRAVNIKKKLRRFSSTISGAWDIEYLLQVSGMNNSLTTQTQLEDAAFVNQTGDNISTFMNITLEFLSTREVVFLKTPGLSTFSPSELPAVPRVENKQSTFSTTAQPIIFLVIVGICFLLISICALKFDYRAIKMDRAKPLGSRLVPSSV